MRTLAMFLLFIWAPAGVLLAQETPDQRERLETLAGRLLLKPDSADRLLREMEIAPGEEICLYNDIGLLFMRQERYPEASVFFERSAMKGQKLYGKEKNADVALAWLGAGKAYEKQGNYLKSLEACQQALTWLHFSFGSSNTYRNPGSAGPTLSAPMFLQVLETKARAAGEHARETGSPKDWHLALTTWQLALEVPAEEDQRSVARGQEHIYPQLLHAAFMLYEITRERRYIETAFEVAERRRASRLRAGFPVPGIRGLPGRIFASQTPSVGDLQSALQRRATATLSYSFGAGELYVFMVSTNAFYAERLTADSAFFRDLDEMRAGLQAGEGGTFDRESAHRLYQRLVAPFRPYFKGKDHLIIIPDAPLGFLPFEALIPDTASDRYLLHDYALSYATCVSALTDIHPYRGNRNRQNVLAIAPFDRSPSEKEVLNIKADLLLGTAASKEAFLKAAPGYTILHLSTRASATPSGNAVIRLHPDGRDGRASGLSLPDICGMRLNKVHLTVLSTPLPGSGGLPGNNGITAMAQAFWSAGCPNLIPTLWETEPEAAGRIMMKLHWYIRKGYDYAKALQKARIDYLENPLIDKKLKSPACWAAFILIGEADTSVPSHKFFYYFALALTATFVVYVLRIKNRPEHAEHQEHPQTIRQSYST